MIFTQTPLPGAYMIDIEKRKDARGFFSRTWCQKECENYGLSTAFVQANMNFSEKKGTIRGLHYQQQPFQEIKLVRCTKGAIFDVIIDVRPHSATYGQWVSTLLTGENHRTLYVPEGFAHGYQTLEDDTEVFYPTTQFFTPEVECGIRWDDPAFEIEWPERQSVVVSDKDQSWPSVNLGQLSNNP